MRATALCSLVAALIAGCAASRIAIPGRGDDDGDASASQDAAVTCNPMAPCTTAGATQCMGTLVQRCLDDGHGCLSWSAAAACSQGTGMTCSGGACIDVCTTTDAMTACTQAAEDVNNCCSGTMEMTDPNSLCETFVKAGKDPVMECGEYTLQTDCATVQTNLGAAGGCCCQTDYVCDPENANACVLSCTQKTACGDDTCAPAGVNGIVTEKAGICRDNDGHPLHGCEFVANNGCDNGYDCWKDTYGNEFCTKSCSTDNDCGNPGIACCNMQAKCNVIIGGCGGQGACMACP